MNVSREGTDLTAGYITTGVSGCQESKAHSQEWLCHEEKKEFNAEITESAEDAEFGKIEERFLTYAGRRYRRSDSGRKNRPAPFGMTVGGLSGQMMGLGE